MTYAHFLYVPFTGLGNFQGFRGNRWLRNRIKIFKQFTLESLKAQTNKNFILWVSWRWEEKRNPIVKDFMKFMESVKEFKTVHTFHGLCFYDDKHEDGVERARLADSIHRTAGELRNVMGAPDYVYVTIQPSDDCYADWTVETIQKFFDKFPDYGAVGFTKGFICDYTTKKVSHYNPTMCNDKDKCENCDCGVDT